MTDSLKELKVQLEDLQNQIKASETRLLEDLSDSIGDNPDTLFDFVEAFNSLVVGPMGFAPLKLIKPRGPRSPKPDTGTA